MQTCGAHPRGVRVEWRDGGGRTRLLGITDLGRMMGNDPYLTLSVPDRLGRWEAGRSARGMDPRRKDWVRVQDRAGETSSSSSSSTTTTTSGDRTPQPRPSNPKPPKASKKKPPFESSKEGAPPPKPRPSPRPSPSPRTRARASPPPPHLKPPPSRIGAGTPMGMCRVWGTPGMSLGRRGAMGGPSTK